MSNIDTIVHCATYSYEYDIRDLFQKTKKTVDVNFTHTPRYFSRNCRKTYEFPHPPGLIKIVGQIELQYSTVVTKFGVWAAHTRYRSWNRPVPTTVRLRPPCGCKIHWPRERSVVFRASTSHLFGPPHSPNLFPSQPPQQERPWEDPSPSIPLGSVWVEV